MTVTSRRPPVLAVVALLSGLSPACPWRRAQDSATAVLVGRVADASRSPIAGAQVKATREGTGLVRGPRRTRPEATCCRAWGPAPTR